jgi:predicted RNase H-like nuclease
LSGERGLDQRRPDEGLHGGGYPLLTRIAAPVGVIEVYPHPALVELAGAPERVRYKASKVCTYWREATPSERRGLLYREWAGIVALLEREIEGVPAALTTPGPGASGLEIKAYEDALDAVVCAWVAVCAVEGRAVAFGDDSAAIWIPSAGGGGLASGFR